MRLLSWLGLVLMLISFRPAIPQSEGRILKLEDLTYIDIDRLDRDKAVFVLTFGNLEEHGPHLPIGADFFIATGIRDRLITRLHLRHPTYDFVIVPVVPLGEGGANDAAQQPNHVGTFAVRFETLRNVAIDLGAAIASKGFKNILVVHAHGMPLHNIALTEAATFVSQRYGSRMVNVSSVMYGEGFYGPEPMIKHLGRDWKEKIGFDVHAGAVETSTHLYLRGDQVRPVFRKLKPFSAVDLAQLLRTADSASWPGYFGAPSRANKALGRDLVGEWVERSLKIAELSLAGEDLSTRPIYPSTLPDSERQRLEQPALKRYAEQSAEIDAWLRAHSSTAP